MFHTSPVISRLATIVYGVLTFTIGILSFTAISLAATNVQRMPSEQEVLGTCDAWQQGLIFRLGSGVDPLRTQLKLLLAHISGKTPAAEEAAHRLQFSQCAWLRNVGMRCLEPTNLGPRMLSAVDRLAEKVEIGKVWEDQEDDCLREQAQARQDSLHQLARAADQNGLAATVLKLLPPASFFGKYQSEPHNACRVGDPQVWALDPHFDDWLDCSQWRDELDLMPALDDSISGVQVWIGAPMENGNDYTFSNQFTYTPGNSWTASSSGEDNECSLVIEAVGDSVSVRNTDSPSTCVGTSDSQPKMGQRALFRHAQAEPPPRQTVDFQKSEEFDSHGRPGRAIVDVGGGVAVAWVLGLNQSMQVMSVCGALPAYDELVNFFSRYQQAVLEKNVEKLSALTSFPLQLDTDASQFINRAEDLQAHMDTVFNNSLTSVLRDLDPHFVFCSHGHVSVAAGRIWAKPDASGTLHVYFVDGHAKPRATPKPVTPNS